MLGGKRPVADRSPNGFRLASDGEAMDALQTAWDVGVRYFDTSPWYGRGQSEHRTGRFLYDIEHREQFVVSTKVGRLLHPSFSAHQPDKDSVSCEPNFGALAGWKHGPEGALQFDHRHDYSYDGVMRSFEDSLQRLGMPSVDLLVIHDLDLMHLSPAQLEYHMAQLVTGGCRALEQLKGMGAIKGFGAGVNHLGTMSKYMQTIELDFFLVAQVFSLLHHQTAGTQWCDIQQVPGGAMDELAEAHQRGIGIIAATAFNAGLLVTGHQVPNPICNYRAANKDELSRTSKIEQVCLQHQVPLPAAALQFARRHPAVASLVTGFGSPLEVQQCAKWMAHHVPEEMWHQLAADGLIHPQMAEGTPIQ